MFVVFIERRIVSKGGEIDECSEEKSVCTCVFFILIFQELTLYLFSTFPQQ